MRMSRFLALPVLVFAALTCFVTGASADMPPCPSDTCDPPDVYELFHAKGPVCPLPFSPFSYENATPEDLVCVLDQDDDGLNDEIEGLMAECFVPFFKYDSDENRVIKEDDAGNWITTRRRSADCESADVPCLPDGKEPVALFDVTPAETGMQASIHWLFVYSWDGGFHDADGWGSNYHAGDTERVGMSVEFSQDAGGRWSAELTRVGVNNEWRRGVVGRDYIQIETHHYEFAIPFVIDYDEWTWSVGGNVTSLRVQGGTHPVIYPSAGKHHQSLIPFAEHKYSEVTQYTPYFPAGTMGSRGTGIERMALGRSSCRK